MRRTVIFAAIFFIADVLPALAQTNCDRPIAPAAPDPRTATEAQMAAAVGDAKAFITQSDVYQQCLLDYVKARQKQAAADKVKFDQFIALEANKKIDENQAEKVQVGQDTNAAVAAFKAAHPR